MPASPFTKNVEQAYAAAVRGAAWFDDSARGKLTVQGKEAASFLHNLCTNDIKGLRVGQGCEAFFTSAQARVLAHGYVSRLAEEAYWIDVPAGTGAELLRHLDRHLISEIVELADVSADWRQVHVAGPDAKALLAQVLQSALPDLAELEWMPASGADLAHGRLRRHDFLGIPGFDWVGAKESMALVRERLTAAGAVEGSKEVYETLRVEAGTPVYGLDIDSTNLPQEVGRTERAVSFTKGCYIGQETVARIRTYGHVNRLLVGLRLAGPSAAPANAPVLCDGKEVGQVTSSVVSPRGGGAIALAYLRRGHEAPGTAVTVATAAGAIDAIVAGFPLSDSGPRP